MREDPFFFSCEGERLLGIIAHPEGDADIGVLVIVGGPQYRIGSHRQFVLLSRDLARAGVPTMRFDARGMGDATGTQQGFENLDADIEAAITEFCARAPGIEKVVLWGLCDAASAALFYAWRNARIAGLVLLNPWVRTEQGIAKTYLKHYYARRLLDKAMWRSLFDGQIDVTASLRSAVRLIKRAVPWRQPPGAARRTAGDREPNDAAMTLPARMATGLERFGKDVMFILSGDDFTAQEFRAAIAGDAMWKRALSRNRFDFHEMPDANHTFATDVWRDEVAEATRAWLAKLRDKPRRDSDVRPRS